MSVDMRLDGDFQLVPQTDGDAALIADNACFLQTLKLEAAAAEGDLWYSPTWGWSLLDFKNSVQGELTTLEIEQRVRQKLVEHEEIEVGSIAVTTDWGGDSIAIARQAFAARRRVRFRAKRGRFWNDRLRAIRITSCASAQTRVTFLFAET